MPYRVWAALVFDRLCAMSGKTAAELCQRIEHELGREKALQPATLRTWRNGRAAVPMEALLVVADLVNFRFPGIELLLLGETIDDEQRRRAAYDALTLGTRTSRNARSRQLKAKRDRSH
jgi:hypothetical protein